MRPVTMVNHIVSPIANICSYSNQKVWLSLFGKKDFIPSSKMTDWLMNTLFFMKGTDSLLIENLMFFYADLRII